MPRKSRYTVSTAAGTVAGPNSQTHATPHTDGTYKTGANTSSAQQRARAPPPPHSGKGARQSRVNAIPFRPPRNETRLASTSDIRDARAPATNRKHQPDLHEVVDDHSEDEDYDPEADEVESFDDHLDDLFAAHEVEHQGNANSKKGHRLLENGVTSSMELTVKEALALPSGKTIVLHHNRELQQVGQEMCRKNAVNRSKQLYTHTGGSKTMARKRHEEEQRQGRPIGRGEGWTMSHKKRNGLYMNEDSCLVGEAIELVESQDPSSKEFSQNDSLAQVLGKENPGRVRGLGIGTCPSQYFRNIPEKSDYGVQIEEYQMEIVKLKAEAAELKAAAAEEKEKRQRMEAEAAEEKAKR
ncbi:hypothetical protein Ahy_B02g061292 [Arachis hypogaea]|uniref:Uncharacterized protein n=1 Tax=Arachis hypogaea TaxID=3818 RepID=A0A445AKJ5_ARAHY|nr:hypothetical protein Ahy_B02g061292 [Arachis hypogaea]